MPEEEKVRFPIYWNCPILSLCLNYSNLSDAQMRDMVERTYHITYNNIMDIAFRSGIIHINGDKKYMPEIPYLESMYWRYLNLAIENCR